MTIFRDVSASRQELTERRRCTKTGPAAKKGEMDRPASLAERIY